MGEVLHLFVPVVRERVCAELNIFKDVIGFSIACAETEYPKAKVEAGNAGSGHDPPPQEEIDLLVKHVQWQSALRCDGICSHTEEF